MICGYGLFSYTNFFSKVFFLYNLFHSIIFLEYGKYNFSTERIYMNSQLLAVTEEEIRLHSVKFTMDDIARKLHMSKSTLYQQASSKKVLIRMVWEQVMAEFLEKKERLLSSDLSVKEKILQYCQLFVDTFWALPDGVYLDIEIHYGDIWNTWFVFRMQQFEAMMELLEKGVAEGYFRPVNLNVLRIILITSTKNLNDPVFLREQNMTGSDVMKILEEIILKGIEK